MPCASPRRVRRRLPDALLVAGGPLPTVFPGRFLPHVDVVFRGEADLSFPAFCRDYLARQATAATLGDLPLAAYAGLVAERDGVRVDNPPVHHTTEQIAGFPLPDRGDFDHRAYQREWAHTGHRPTTLLATLGCPYGCEFCSRPVFGNEVRARPLDAVFAEIDDIVRLGYDGLWIADDTFTLHRDYLEEFCRRVAPLGLTWSCLSRANGIDPSTARLMRASGCRRVYLGLESGSQTTLDLMQKQTTVEQGARAVTVYREAGVEVAAFFIVGYPGETAADIEETFAFALGLPLAEISFNVPMPLPGSEALGAPRRQRRRPRLDARERGHLRLRLGHRRGLAAAAHRRDDDGVRGEADERRVETLGQAPEERFRRRLREPGGGGAEAPEPPPQRELPLAREDREAHLGGRELAPERQLLVHQEAAVGPRLAASRGPPFARAAACPAAGTASRGRGSRAGATRRSAASRAPCRRSRRDSRG